MGCLIAIDPGRDTGIALFQNRKLVLAELIDDPVRTAWKWSGRVLDEAVVEVPQIYPGSRANPQDLIKLAVTAGYMLGSVRVKKTHCILPRQWKGQTPKRISNQRALAELEENEKGRIQAKGSRTHNVLDAIGIGLWFVGRL